MNSDTIHVLKTQELVMENQQSHKRNSTTTSVAGNLMTNIAKKYTSARIANEEQKSSTISNRDRLSTSRGRVDSNYRDSVS